MATVPADSSPSTTGTGHKTARRPLVVLTRPEGRNEACARQLQQHGCDTLIMPALELADVSPPDPWPDERDFDLAVFVSGTAVRRYFALRQQGAAQAPAWPAGLRAATVGPSSAQPLRDSGLVPPHLIIHPGPHTEQDSEALWQLLLPDVAKLQRVLIVRGQEGRPWLGRQLADHGAQVQYLPVYQRVALPWLAPAPALLSSALEQERPVFCVLTSTEGAAAFIDNAARHGLLDACRRVHYVVVHPRLREAVEQLFLAHGASAALPAVTVSALGGDALLQVLTDLACTTNRR